MSVQLRRIYLQYRRDPTIIGSRALARAPQICLSRATFTLSQMTKARHYAVRSERYGQSAPRLLVRESFPHEKVLRFGETETDTGDVNQESLLRLFRSKIDKAEKMDLHQAAARKVVLAALDAYPSFASQGMLGPREPWSIINLIHNTY